MQDNPFDEKFMDDAWSLMHKQLDEVMPPERKRRFVLWWWLLPSLGGLALFLLFLLPQINSTNPSKDGMNQDHSINSEPIAKTKENISTKALQHKEAINNKTINTDIEIEPNSSIKLEKQEQTQAALPTSLKQESIGNNNPNIPNEQDLVTEPSFDTPEAKVLHTVPEQPASDQRITPVTDLRFLTPFELLYVPANKVVLSQTDFALIESKVFKPKISKLYNRRGTAAAFLSTGYYGPHNQTDFGVGIGWKQQRGRFFMRLEPGFHIGATTLSAPDDLDNDNALLSDAESGGNIGTSSDPEQPEQFASVDAQGSINARFTALTIPVTLGYHIKEKWSLEGGIQWGRALDLRSQEALFESTFIRLNNSAGSYMPGERNANLNQLFAPKSWFEGRIGVNYHWSKRITLQASYRFGQANFSNTDQWVWHRDLYAIQLRYRLR